MYSHVSNLLKMVFFVIIGYLLNVLFHESLHVVLRLLFGDKLIGIRPDFFAPSVVFKSQHLNNPLITFTVCVGPLLISICAGVIILALSVRIKSFQLRKLSIVMGGVLVAQLCFQPLNIYYITGDIVNWTTNLNILLFLRRYYWIILVLCIPFIFFATKTYFKALHSDVLVLAISAKIYLYEIFVPISFCLLMLNVGTGIFSDNSEELTATSLEGRYLYNKVYSSKNKPTIISVLSVENPVEINKIIINRKFDNNSLVCFIESEPEGSFDNLIKYRGSILNEGKIIRVDYLMREVKNGVKSKLEVENILPFNKTIPEASKSEIPAMLMFSYYCIVALASTFWVTCSNRKKMAKMNINTGIVQ